MKNFNIDFTIEILKKEVEKNKDLQGVCNVFDTNLTVDEEKNIVIGIALTVGNNASGDFISNIVVFDAGLDIEVGLNIESWDDIGYTDITDIGVFEVSKEGYEKALTLYESTINKRYPMKKDDFYLYGYVEGKFIVIELNTLGETYQQEEDKNVEVFTNESNNVKLEMFKAYKADSIYYESELKWEKFYNDYKNKYDRDNIERD